MGYSTNHILGIENAYPIRLSLKKSDPFAIKIKSDSFAVKKLNEINGKTQREVCKLVLSVPPGCFLNREMIHIPLLPSADLFFSDPTEHIAAPKFHWRSG